MGNLYGIELDGANSMKQRNKPEVSAGADGRSTAS
jgi:hypothetical protein